MQSGNCVIFNHLFLTTHIENSLNPLQLHNLPSMSSIDNSEGKAFKYFPPTPHTLWHQTDAPRLHDLATEDAVLESKVVCEAANDTQWLIPVLLLLHDVFPKGV